MAFIGFLFGLLLASKDFHFHIASMQTVLALCRYIFLPPYANIFLCLAIISRFGREGSFEFGLFKSGSMLNIFFVRSLLFVE